MQDRVNQVDETSCNARPDHTVGSNSTKLTSSTARPLLLSSPTWPRHRFLSRRAKCRHSQGQRHLSQW